MHNYLEAYNHSYLLLYVAHNLSSSEFNADSKYVNYLLLGRSCTMLR